MITGARITNTSLFLDSHLSQKSWNSCSPGDATLISHENAQDQLKQSSLFKYIVDVNVILLLYFIVESYGGVKRFGQRSRKIVMAIASMNFLFDLEVYYEDG